MKIQNEKEFPFQIGADPEFLMFHGARALNAQEIIKPIMGQNLPLGPEHMGFVIERAGNVGWDGADSTGEFRPLPSKNPTRVVDNLRILITTLITKIPTLDYTTLSIGAPIGGHIHLEDPTNALRLKTDMPNNSESDKNKKLLATFMLPIIASEHRISSGGRLRAGYGDLCDFRVELRGSTQVSVLEIRSISAEWTVNPEIAYATLSYAGVIWHEMLKRRNELFKQNIILKTIGQIEIMQKIMLSDLSVLENTYIRQLKNLIRKFEKYPEFKEEVDFILTPKRVLNLKKKLGWNLASGWFPKSIGRQPLKKELMSERKLRAKLKSPELINIKETFSVSFNKDYRVESFADSITERIAAFNWKLNHEYLLFGLKRDINGYIAYRHTDNKFFCIPQNQSKETTLQSCKKMEKRFEDHQRQKLRIDPKTGRINPQPDNQILIGIPYEERTARNFKSLISLIWRIEKNILPPKLLRYFPEPEATGKTDLKEENTASAIINRLIETNPENEQTPLNRLQEEEMRQQWAVSTPNPNLVDFWRPPNTAPDPFNSTNDSQEDTDEDGSEEENESAF